MNKDKIAKEWLIFIVSIIFSILIVVLLSILAREIAPFEFWVIFGIGVYLFVLLIRSIFWAIKTVRNSK